jgi:2-C-methyl-D-erythritol 4-phosphate cytidylyltransferase
MKKFALIMAGGSGTRMIADIPKQFIEIAGLPVIMHTILKFEKFDPEIQIIIVLPENQFDYWFLLCTKYNFNKSLLLAKGGETRFHSVKNGLQLIGEKGIVFIHDAVRPMVSEKTIKNCLSVAIEKGNALPVIPVNDSVRIKKNGLGIPADRSEILLVQTPQTFHTDEIISAYRNASHTNFTDDATVLESTGITINLVEGNRENIKITTPADLIIADAFLKHPL